jgi:hypothetical protein
LFDSVPLEVEETGIPLRMEPRTEPRVEPREMLFLGPLKFGLMILVKYAINQ